MGWTDRLDEMGKPAWIALLVLSFILFWPAGFALLAYLFWSGRMGCGGRGRRWKERMHQAAGEWHRRHHSSGNHAFDEYREAAIKKLEEEEKEFRSFLDRLRHAKDKEEFDQFMAERLHRPQGPEPQPGT